MKSKRLEAWFGNTKHIRILLIVFFLLLAIWAVTPERNSLVIGYVWPFPWLTDFLTSVGPKLAGIAIGVVTIDYLNERRQEKQFKAQLIRQMASPHNDVADPALRELTHHNWVSDGSLQGANLIKANLTKAWLVGADLAEADLTKAILTEALLTRANLFKAFLSKVTLIEAKLIGTMLKEVVVT